MQGRSLFTRFGANDPRCPPLLARVLRVLSFIGLLIPDPLSAADERTFTEDVARRMAAALPGVQVTVTNALELKIVYPHRPNEESRAHLVGASCVDTGRLAGMATLIHSAPAATSSRCYPTATSGHS